jgi:hypothetical protein
MAIAHCNKNSDCHDLGERFPSQHLERWAPNILIGYINIKSHLNLWLTYQIGCASIVLLIFVITVLLQKMWHTKIIIFTTLLLNPYTFRAYFFSPPTISDASFFLGISLLVFGLIKKNFLLLVISVVIATFSRQTAIVLLPIFFLGYHYNYITFKQAFILSTLLLVLFFINQAISINFFHTDIAKTYNTHITLNGWQASYLDIQDIYKFLARILFTLLLWSPTLLLNIDKKRIIFVALCIILIAAQPLLSGPGITGGNFSRLITYATPFLCLLFVDKKQDLLQTLQYIGLIFLTSLHHHYSVLNNKFIFGILVISSALLCILSLGIKKYYAKK